MLVEFTFGNFRSFKDKSTLSMASAPHLQSSEELDALNVFTPPERPKLRLLRTAGIYGANASGKSNTIFALGAFRAITVLSANNNYSLPDSRFQFHTHSPIAPYYFEIVFVLESKVFRYGFEVENNPTIISKVRISKEWLYVTESTTRNIEKTLFERVENTVIRGRDFSEGSALLINSEMGREESLFLSLTAQLGAPNSLSRKLLEYFYKLEITSGENMAQLNLTQSLLQTEEQRLVVSRALQAADTGTHSVYLQPRVDGSSPTLMSVHPIYDESGIETGVNSVPALAFESQGTFKFYQLLGPIAYVLANGLVLLIDEIEAHLHPLLIKRLISVFQSNEHNPNNAQLIFTTHDTNLLSKKQFRRDQVWFVEKDGYGASHLYSLAEFKESRREQSFSYEENYIAGKYGAIPFLSDTFSFFEQTKEVNNGKA